MHRKNVSRVLEVYKEYIRNTPDYITEENCQDVFLYLDAAVDICEVTDGEDLCERFLLEFEIALQQELGIVSISEAEYPLLLERMKPYMDKLPEYQYLLEKYQ